MTGQPGAEVLADRSTTNHLAVFSKITVPEYIEIGYKENTKIA